MGAAEAPSSPSLRRDAATSSPPGSPAGGRGGPSFPPPRLLRPRSPARAACLPSPRGTPPRPSRRGRLRTHHRRSPTPRLRLPFAPPRGCPAARRFCPRACASEGAAASRRESAVYPDDMFGLGISGGDIETEASSQVSCLHLSQLRHHAASTIIITEQDDI
ncbi:hypothetical protein U9M48_011681 [Paspalum notatum var. saurae]|uniref:Uncharacterized protein n=1 Tax=Paspalum notatum var. saurae TaxID=547442 RepID=A0AAQ3WHR6_PASNO